MVFASCQKNSKTHFVEKLKLFLQFIEKVKQFPNLVNKIETLFALCREK